MLLSRIDIYKMQITASSKMSLRSGDRRCKSLTASFEAMYRNANSTNARKTSEQHSSGQRQLFIIVLEFLTLYGHESHIVGSIDAATGGQLPYLICFSLCISSICKDRRTIHCDSNKQCDTIVQRPRCMQSFQPAAHRQVRQM